MADKRSDLVQIAQDTLSVAAQATKVTIVDGSGTGYSAGFAFFRNGVSTQAVLDTSVSTNNRPAPVVTLAGDSLGPYSIAAGATDATTQRVVANIQRNGNELDYGAGNASTGTFRVVISSNQSAIPVTLSSVSFGNGVVDATTIRVSVATDNDLASQTTLAALNTKVPSNLTVTSTRLLVDGSGVTQPISGSVSVSSSALPTGASTEAKQDAGNASLVSIDSKLTAPLSVTGPLTDTQLRASAVPVSAASLPLPSGASTEATLSTLNGKVPANLTVTATRLLVDGSGITQPVSGSVSVSSSALPSGAATETTLAAINTKTPALGQAAMAASSPVVIASNQTAIKTNPQNVLQPFEFDYISFAYASTTDTVTYKTGGNLGSTVATVVVTYTDATKVDITSVVRT